MDLYKAFHCIPHDILRAKLTAYVFDKNILSYIYSYLNDRKTCVKINNMKNVFTKIVPSVPPGSVVTPILLSNVFLNDFFFFFVYCIST